MEGTLAEGHCEGVVMVQVAISILAVLAVLASPIPASAQDFPTRPIRLMVGFGPGGAADIVARVIAQRLGGVLGQQIVVENRPGAGTSLAAEAVARAPKDGYTLLLATIANPVHAVVSPAAGFDFAKDLAPIGFIGTTPNLMVVHPGVGARSVRELIAIAKAKPDELLFGSSGGVGTPTHLAGELFNLRAGTRLVHVPYPGSAQALTDLLAGRIHIVFAPPAAVMPHVAEGKLLVLATTDARRSDIAPGVPTMTEAGVTGFDTGLWYGLMAPAGTPAAVIDRLNRGLGETLTADATVTALRPQGVEPRASTADEFRRFIQAEMQRWDEVVRTAGLKAK
jgi:tripartite-type tricarboxylate transporter receptor subunit TctC